jgi:hypothetical protein
MGSSTPHAVPRLSEKAVVWRALGQLMASSPDGALHAFEHEDGEISEVGARVAELVDGRRSIQAIAQVVVGEFEVDFDRALADTLHFVDVLVEKKVFTL